MTCRDVTCRDVTGTAGQPFQHQLTIQLRGRHRVGSDAAAADIPMPAGTPNIGWKTLGTWGDNGWKTLGTWGRQWLEDARYVGGLEGHVQCPIRGD